jgi:hypothetical protein
VKRESRKRRRLSWDKFVAQMEHNLYRPKPNTYKILKYLNQEIRETRNIKCPLNALLTALYKLVDWCEL